MIHGSKVKLRPATELDRHDVYQWLAASDVTPSMMGPPVFSDVPIPSWRDFCADYVPHYFDGSRPGRGQSFIVEVDAGSVGHVAHNGFDAERHMAELDIWMRSQAVCGLGYGTDALLALMRHLRQTFGVRTFIMRPSRRNERAVRAYEKAGFRRSTLPLEEQTRIYGAGDYSDTITLECEPTREPSNGRIP